jgi:hypothetical protein
VPVGVVPSREVEVIHALEVGCDLILFHEFFSRLLVGLSVRALHGRVIANPWRSQGMAYRRPGPAPASGRLTYPSATRHASTSALISTSAPVPGRSRLLQQLRGHPVVRPFDCWAHRQRRL